MVHEDPRNSLASNIRALAAKMHKDRGVEQSDLPPEYRNARRVILDKTGYSDEDIKEGRFDHEIHATLVQEIANKYNVSEARASQLAHSSMRRISTRVQHAIVTVLARIIGPASATSAGALVGKFGVSYLQLTAGGIGASAMSIAPLLLLVGTSVYAGHRAQRWTGEALESSRVIRDIWQSPTKREELRQAVIGEQNLAPLFSQLHIEHKSADWKKRFMGTLYTALGVGLGTMGVGLLQTLSDPGVAARVYQGLSSGESPFTYLPREFFKEGFNTLATPVVNLWEYIVNNLRTP